MRTNRSFTLIELLIASSILAVVMMVLYASFGSGIFGYRGIEEQIEVYQSARSILGVMDKDLRNNFAYSVTESKFTGSNNKVSFFTLVDDYEETGFIRNYAFVSYYLETGKLMRLCRRNQASLNTALEVKPEELSSGVESISFTYIYLDNGTMKEKDTWDDLLNMPAAVKVKLIFKKKYAYEFERTIYLARTPVQAEVGQ